MLQLFSEMEKKDLLDENNVDNLQKIIKNVYPALEKRIILYKTESEFNCLLIINLFMCCKIVKKLDLQNQGLLVLLRRK